MHWTRGVTSPATVCCHWRAAIAARRATPCRSFARRGRPPQPRPAEGAGRHMCVPPPARRDRSGTSTHRTACATPPPFPAATGVPAGLGDLAYAEDIIRPAASTQPCRPRRCPASPPRRPLRPTWAGPAPPRTRPLPTGPAAPRGPRAGAFARVCPSLTTPPPPFCLSRLRADPEGWAGRPVFPLTRSGRCHWRAGTRAHGPATAAAFPITRAWFARVSRKRPVSPYAPRGTALTAVPLVQRSSVRSALQPAKSTS